MKKIRYDKTADSLFIELSDKHIDYAEDEGQFVMHFSKEGDPVLIEIFDARNFALNLLSSVIREEEISLI